MSEKKDAGQTARMRRLICAFVSCMQQSQILSRRDPYYYILGVPENLREVAKNSKPALEVSNSGNSWTLKTTVGDRVKDSTFNIGEEFESKGLTGESMKVK